MGITLIIGGVSSGKRAYLLNHTKCDKSKLKPSLDSDIVYKLNDVIIDILKAGGDPLTEIISAIRDGQTIVYDEVGSGVVPIDRFERNYQDIAGKVAILIAEKASTVIRLHCGVPVVIKGDSVKKITLIRHGQTAGNLAKRYIGRTDEEILLANIDKRYPFATKVFSSPMKRSIQTASLIYGDSFSIIDELKECDFGDFENKTYDELIALGYAFDDMQNYPNGENTQAFKHRALAGFYKALYLSGACSDVAIVTHGGVIMAIMEALTGESFYNWHVDNLSGYTFMMSAGTIMGIEKL